ncbi:MAG TPA: DegT/DnrJ/EryC1/StrS family aminotransferase [Gaiellaceae bacterium]|jgi:perosamine synthetase|nr:DegT/DnrJ/EryC1/StrS family aminotransferase [Gaiellaceae bacterium]
MTGPTASEPIGLSAPYVDETEEELVLEVIRSGRLAFGPMIEEFERALAERVDAPYVAAVSSGTAGLHLCMKLADIAPGDEVVTTPLSFIASANAIVYEGGTPVFVDVDPMTLNLDPAAVEAAITPRTKALVLVDLFGYPLDMDSFAELAARHDLAIIEDACEALGATYRGQQVGSFGHPAVFAFYPNKQVTTGEGGAVALGTEDEWDLVKSLANQGRTDRGETFAHDHIGYNYRLDELSAALGVAQLRKLDTILELRDEVAARYNALLAEVEGIRLLCPDDDVHRRSWFVYVVFVDPPAERSSVMAFLAAEGIASKPYLPAIHLQAAYRDRFGFSPGMYPVAEAAGAQGLALPFHTGLSAGDQERVVGALARALQAA